MWKTLVLACFLGQLASFASAECIFGSNCTAPDHCYDTQYDVCIHKPLLPLSWRDIVTFILALIICALASSAGIGGGTIFLPLLLLITNFDIDHASPIAALMVFWSSIGGVLLNLFKRHPTADRPRIYFDVLFVMEPVILVGTVIGLLLFVVLPEYVKYLTLVLLFLIIGVRSFQRGRTLYRKEASTAKSDEALVHLAAADSMQSVESAVAAGSKEQPQYGELAAMLAKDSQTPFLAISLMFIIVAIDITFSALRGLPDGNPSVIGIPICSTPYWSLLAGRLVFLFSCSYGFATYLRHTYNRKVALNYPFVDGDINWTVRNAYLIPTGTAIAGIMSGMLGVGGGFIISPLLQELGVLPQIATPTSLGTIIYTILPVIAEYWMMGRFLVDYSVVFSVLAAISGFAGQTVVTRLVDKHKKTYVLVFILTFALFVSAILIGVFSVPPAFAPALMHFNSVCSPSIKPSPT